MNSTLTPRILAVIVLLPVLLFIVLSLSLPSARGQNKKPTDWPTFGADPGGQRYAPLTQINADNVTALARAWTYHMKPEGAAIPGAESAPTARGPRRRGNPESQATPLVVNGVMYLTTAYNRVVALEPETGQCVWEYALKSGAPSTRGLEYWAGDAQTAPRLFF